MGERVAAGVRAAVRTGAAAVVTGARARAVAVTLVAATMALPAAALLCGCGGIEAPDLFILERSGPGAQRLTLLVNEEGGLRCNNGRELKLGDPQLVQARALQEELKGPAGERLSLPARPNSVYGYYVRTEAGSVSFADNSPNQPKVLRNLALFALQVAQQDCRSAQPGG